MNTPKTHVGFILGLILGVATIAGCAAPLYDASEQGDLPGIRRLLDQGAKIDEKSDGHTALMEASREGHLEAVRLLLDRGAQIDMVSIPYHQTALSLAAYKGHTEVVRLLLERGADASIPDAGGTQIIWWAVRGAGKAEIVRMLLDHGADVTLKGREFDFLQEWRTPLAVAQERGHTKIMRMLQEAEARQLGTASPTVAATAPAVRVSDAPVRIPASDVDTPPPRQVRRNANAYAIVIGIEQYRQKLPKADYAAHDARIVASYLTKVLGYPEENVVTLLNEHATNVDFAKYFEKWLLNNAVKGSTVFIYYSGHGAPNPKTGDAYLVPYDGDPSFISETGYPLKRMYGALGKLPAKEIIVALDSCFSGGGGRSVIAKGARPLVMNLQSNINLSKNIVVLSASSGDQISSTYEEKGHGLFTYFLLKGINEGDVVLRSGSIAIDELFRYIKPQVERIARKQYNNEQTPQLIR